MKKIIKIFPLVLIILFYSAGKADVPKYIYVDGNNNEYIVRTDSLHYEPVQPANSSSGEYSGGEKKSVGISSDQFTRIESQIKQIIKDKSNQIDNRLMGCGTLVIGKKSLFIDAKSELKMELEKILKEILN